MHKIIKVEADVIGLGCHMNEPDGMGVGHAVVIIDNKEYSLYFEIMHSLSYTGQRKEDASFSLFAYSITDANGREQFIHEFVSMHENDPIFADQDCGEFFEDLEDELRGYPQVKNVFSELRLDFKEGRGEEEN